MSTTRLTGADTRGEIFRFGTKAETLERLAPMLKQVRLCDQIITTITEWRQSKDDVIDRVVARFPGRPLAIRSSSTQEDGVIIEEIGELGALKENIAVLSLLCPL